MASEHYLTAHVSVSFSPHGDHRVELVSCAAATDIAAAAAGAALHT